MAQRSGCTSVDDVTLCAVQARAESSAVPFPKQAKIRLVRFTKDVRIANPPIEIHRCLSLLDCLDFFAGEGFLPDRFRMRNFSHKPFVLPFDPRSASITLLLGEGSRQGILRH